MNVGVRIANPGAHEERAEGDPAGCRKLNAVAR